MAHVVWWKAECTCVLPVRLPACRTHDTVQPTPALPAHLLPHRPSFHALPPPPTSPHPSPPLGQVVVFVKGTRQQPQCGFSFKMMSMLNTLRADYEVVNVLDEFHNPGLRDAIKNYSQWPTIPQVGGRWWGAGWMQP